MKNETRLLIAVTDSQSIHLLRGYLKYLRDVGFEVTVVSAPGPALQQAAAREGVAGVAVPMRREPAPLHDLLTLARLWHMLGVVRPTIVVASTPKAGLLLSIAAWLRRVPRRIYLVRGLPVETATGWRRRLIFELEKVAAAVSTDVVCISRSLRERVVSLGVARGSKVVVVGPGSSNGIDIGYFTPHEELDILAAQLRSRLQIPRQARVIGFVGRIAVDKGFDVLVEVWRRLAREHPDTHLLIAGGRDSRQPVPRELEDALRSESRVHFLGHVTELRPIYRAIDLLLLPTRREGFGNVLIEAAALERPVVASDVTGCRDAVLGGVTGELVPPTDIDGFVRAVTRFLDEPERMRHAGREGRRWVAATFPREHVWHAWKQFLRA